MTRLHLNRFHLIPTILFLPHIHGIIQASFLMISSLNPRLSSALFSAGSSAQLWCIFRGEQHVWVEYSRYVWGGVRINKPPPAVADAAHPTAMFIPQFTLTTQPRCISKPQTKSRVIKSFILVNEDINSSSCV